MSTQPDMVIPVELSNLFDGRKIHPDAHVSDEMLRALSYFQYVGSPKDWMHKILMDAEGLTLDDLPQEFVTLHERLSFVQSFINAQLSSMTTLANTGNPDNPDDRKTYQKKERSIMEFVITSVQDLLTNPDRSLLLLALRGAKFFEPMLSKFAKNTLETEAKRIRLEEKPGDNGTPFIVGLGDIKVPTPEEVAMIDTFIMPDDCLSTAMTQLVYLERLLEVGYRPKNIVMLFTVGTLAGIKHVYDKFNELVAKFGLDCKLHLQCGGLCFRVNDEMYLMTESGLYLVGDMGKWNEAVEN